MDDMSGSGQREPNGSFGLPWTISDSQMSGQGGDVTLVLPDLQGYSLDGIRALSALARDASETLVAVDENHYAALPDQATVVTVPPKTPWLVRVGVAARSARGKFLVVLSDGTFPAGPSSLPLLIRAVQNWEIGIAGSCLVNPWGRVTAAGWSLGGPRGLFPNGRGRRARRPRMPDPSPLRLNVDALPAGAWALRKSTWDELGPLGTSLPRPWAEADLCQSIWQARRSCVCVVNSLAVAGRPPRPIRLDPAFAARWPSPRLSMIDAETPSGPEKNRIRVHNSLHESMGLRLSDDSHMDD
jgi:hypothetical protein